jgi:hypothetical protein
MCACLRAVARRQHVDVEHTLSLYSNPFKQSLYLLGSLGFVVTGPLLLRDPKFRAGGPNVVMAYICIGFLGLGTVVFVYSMAHDLLVRHPMLQVDARGWTFEPALGQHRQHVGWQDIGRVALYCQRIESTRRFYLVLEAWNPDELPPSRARALDARIYPSLSRAMMTVPLNSAFVRASPAKVGRLLHSVQAEFSGELRSYGIAVADKIQDM